MVVLLGLITVTSILKVVLFIAVLSILIVLHEYGHFIFARLNGVRVLEFSVGMGPLLVAHTSKASGTQYSLRALPIGGYCAMHGEDNKTSEADQQREFRKTVVIDGREYDDDNFQAKAALRRLVIILAGPVANFILALLILFVSAVAFGVQSTHFQPRVGPLVQGMPAQRAGLHAGDTILSIGGKAVTDGATLVSVIHGSLNKPLTITYARDGVQKTITLTPQSLSAGSPHRVHRLFAGLNLRARRLARGRDANVV